MGLANGRLIQVTNIVILWRKHRDFEKWPLNTVWPLNTGPLYTDSTVLLNQWRYYDEHLQKMNKVKS